MSGIEVALLGAAASAGTGAAAATAATTGLFGVGGAFSLGATLSTLGTGLSVLGGLQQSQATASNQEYNARLAEVNARQRDLDAKMARRSAENEADRVRKATRRRLGSIRARQAASGVVTGEGSPLLVQTEQLTEGLLEERKQLFTGEVEAQGFKQQSAVERMKAQAGRERAKTTKKNAILTGASTLFTKGAGVLA